MNREEIERQQTKCNTFHSTRIKITHQCDLKWSQNHSKRDFIFEFLQEPEENMKHLFSKNKLFFLNFLFFHFHLADVFTVHWCIFSEDISKERTKSWNQKMKLFYKTSYLIMLWFCIVCDVMCTIYGMNLSVRPCTNSAGSVWENERIAHGFERHTLILLGIHNVTDKWIVGLIYNNFMFHIHVQPANNKLQTANNTMRRCTVHKRQATSYELRATHYNDSNVENGYG